jgi:outer membrane protein assembly factor BamB
MGATGILSCVQLEDGALRWSKDVVGEYRSSNPTWGNSCSPLVYQDLVVVSAGGRRGRSLVAYDRETGDPVWQGGNAAMGYSSPQARFIAGVEQIIVFNHSSVASHSPSDGHVLWEFPWSKAQPNVTQPLPLPNDRLLVSSGYGVGSALLGISRQENGRFKVEKLWQTPRLKAKFTNLVFFQGFVYGLDDGILLCLDPSDGKVRWKKGRYGHGQVILVDEILLLQTEEGELVLIEPNPEEHRELARIQVFGFKTWNPPALAGNFLFVRNEREAACYRLATR